jgi:4-hydroxybenzoate polyprenyltransferase
MFSFLKLVRVQNLLIIAFTQYAVRWCIIYPFLQAQGLEFQLSHLQFFLLSLSTVMIAAAGYAINDYFDVKMDKINKPDEMVIDKGVKRRVAIGAHSVINVLAIGIALVISYMAGFWKLAVIHFICATGLWFYSTDFKRQFLIGNLVIALFTALVPLIVGVYDLYAAYAHYSVFISDLSFKGAWLHVLGVSFFAFFITLAREIIKDIEDVEGDKEYGCKTMPIVIGIGWSKVVVTALLIFVMICLFYGQAEQWMHNDWPSFYYFTFGLQIPFLYLIYRVVVADTPKKFREAGNITKLIMLSGICYLFVFAYTLLNYLHAIQ